MGLPWRLDSSVFPACWFGSNGSAWESEAQLRRIGRYSLAIIGWQHLTAAGGWDGVVYLQLSQAAALKRTQPSLPVFVYASLGWAFGMNAAVLPLMSRPEYSSFFLQSYDGPEYTRTNCQQMHSNNPRCIGWFWNFANESAREYYISKVVLPLATATTIDGVFFDAVNYGYDIPEVKPWGKTVINVPDCGLNDTWSGCEILVNGTLDVLRRSAMLLNRFGKLPIFSNPAGYTRPPAAKVWLDERRLVNALDGSLWMRYYESARAEQVIATRKPGGAMIDDMLREGDAGVSSVMHAYYHRPDHTKNESGSEDPTAHVATFLLVRRDHWYYSGSTGWFDSDFEWSEVYDKAAKCGSPVARATKIQPGVYTRTYEGCQVTVNCTYVQQIWPRLGCEGNILLRGGGNISQRTGGPLSTMLGANNTVL